MKLVERGNSYNEDNGCNNYDSISVESGSDAISVDSDDIVIGTI